jgi:8-oxo-dGTP diphosphatase
MEKIAWILIRDGRLLVARNRDREKFYLPGGRQEPGETDAQTLAREIAEELTAVIDEATLRHVATVTAERDGAAGTVHMTCYTADHHGELLPAAEIAEIAWVTGAHLDRVSPAEEQVIAVLLATGQLRSA